MNYFETWIEITQWRHDLINVISGLGMLKSIFIVITCSLRYTYKMNMYHTIIQLNSGVLGAENALCISSFTTRTPGKDTKFRIYCSLRLIIYLDILNNILVFHMQWICLSIDIIAWVVQLESFLQACVFLYLIASHVFMGNIGTWAMMGETDAVIHFNRTEKEKLNKFTLLMTFWMLSTSQWKVKEDEANRK